MMDAEFSKFIDDVSFNKPVHCRQQTAPDFN